jgi:putative phage-type endonuclease
MFNTPTNVLIQTVPETEQAVTEQNTDTVIKETSVTPEQVVKPVQAVVPKQETDTGMKLKDNLLRLRNRVKALLKKPQPVQRSPEWYANRNTLVTASEAASCLTTSKKVCERYANLYNITNFKYNDTKSANSYEKMNDYILKKCKAFYGEKVFFDSVYTLWGKKYEQIAVNLYKRMNNTDVYDFGLLKHPYLKWLGASPDGITPDGVMLEIKCPYSRKIKPNYVPFHYYIQVQIQLEVALLETADFMECEIKELDTLEDYCGVGLSPPHDDESVPETAGLSPPHDDANFGFQQRGL